MITWKRMRTESVSQSVKRSRSPVDLCQLEVLVLNIDWPACLVENHDVWAGSHPRQRLLAPGLGAIMYSILIALRKTHYQHEVQRRLDGDFELFPAKTLTAVVVQVQLLNASTRLARATEGIAYCDAKYIE
jgi:hypothetical protein